MTDLSQLSDEELMGMLQQTAPIATPQNNSFLREPAMAAMYANKGISAAASMPGDVGAAYDKFIGQPFAKAVTGQTPSFGLADLLGGTAEQNNKLGQQAGFIDNPSLAPQNTGEQYLAAVSQGVGGAIPSIAINPVGAAAQLLSGAGGGAGAKAVHDIWPDSVPGKETIAPLVGSLAGGTGTLMAADSTIRGVNAIRGVTSPILDAYKEAGITPRFAGDVTGDPKLQMKQAYAMQNAPWMMESSAKKNLDEFGNSVENIASKFGGSATMQEAGKAVQDEGNNWLQNFKLQSANKWNRVDTAVGANTAVPLSNIKQAITDITAPAQGNPAAAAFLKSPLAKQVIGILKLSPTGQVPWQTARALKTRLGQYLENPELISDAGGAQAKMLYGAISNDMGAAVASNPIAKANFDAANAYTTQGHNFIDGVLSNVVGKGIKPEDAATSLLQSGRSGGTTLQALRTEMPSAADELAAVSVRRAAMAQPGSQNALGSKVSPSQWLNNLDPTRRMSPEAYDALFANPAAQKKMLALDTVADSMRDTEKFLNRSNTSSAHEMGGMEKLMKTFGPAYIGYETYEKSGSMPAALALGGSAALMASQAPINAMATNTPWLTRLMATPGMKKVPNIAQPMSAFGSIVPPITY